MKKIALLFALIAVMNLYLYSQEGYNLIDENATWVQEVFSSDGINPDSTYYFEFQINGDTILENGINKKLYANGIYWGGLQEVDNRVIYTTIGISDTILDFNLAIGDTVIIKSCVTFEEYDCQYMTLETIDSVALSDGSIRKRMNFHGYNAGDFLLEEFNVSWIDGIGSTRGIIIFTNCGVLRLQMGFSQVCWGRLLCYQNGASLLFNNSEDEIFDCTVSGVISEVVEPELSEANFSIYPNPAREEVHISIETVSRDSALEYAILDHLGRKLFKSEIKGAYFKIDVSKLENGLFWIEVITTGSRIIMPLVKH